jgi:hypothetical protein
LKNEQETILRTVQGLNTSIKIKNFYFIFNLNLLSDSHSTIEPRNGGCEPRVICEEVPVDRTSSDNIISYPQCLEVHRCGGCCQEPQFPCVPVRQESVTFSPVNKKKNYFSYKNLSFFFLNSYY